MIYIILFIAFLVLSIFFSKIKYGVKRDFDDGSLVVYDEKEDNPFFNASVFFMIIFAVFSSVTVGMGLTDYPELSSKYSACIAYEQTIQETAKIYNSEIPVQSLKQLTDYSKMVSDYNKNLTFAKTIKKSKVFWWFGDSAFISDKIFDLKEIGNK